MRWDERAYVVFVETLDERGVSGIRQWMHDYPINESLQKSPLFLRVGFIVPAMLTCKALGRFNVDNLAWLSFACGVGLVLLGGRFAENLINPKMSILCAILLIISPLAAGLSRRAMQDSFAALVVLGCLYFFDEAWRRRSVCDLIALGISLCLALLTKESSLLLYPMMVLAAAYYFGAMKLWPSRWILLPLIAAPLVYFAIELYVCGGLTNFVGTYRTYASLQQTLDYTLHFEKGPWFRYLLDFFAIAPVTFIVALTGFSTQSDASVHHGRNLALIYVVSGILLFGAMPVVNVRLVLFIDMFLRLAAAVGIGNLAVRFKENWSRRVWYLAISLVVLIDATQFYQIFVRGNVYSPTTFLLLRAEGFYDVHP